MVAFPETQDAVDDPNFGLFGSDSTDIDAISGVIDLYPEENHNLPVTKTKYPVEDGSSRTDNFVVEPEKVILRGFVSDLQPSFFGLVQISNKSRGKEAWNRIRELKNSGELVTVVTTLGVYENMLVTNVDSAVSSETGKSLAFTITLEETLIAETETVQLPPVNTSESTETKASDIPGGQKQSEVLSEGGKTLLQDIVSTISGVF